MWDTRLQTATSRWNRVKGSDLAFLVQSDTKRALRQRCQRDPNAQAADGYRRNNTGNMPRTISIF